MLIDFFDKVLIFILGHRKIKVARAAEDSASIHIKFVFVLQTV